MSIIGIQSKTDLIGWIAGLLSFIPAVYTTGLLDLTISVVGKITLAFLAALVSGFAGKLGARLYEIIANRLKK